MTDPGLTERRGTGQSRGRRGGPGHAYGGVCRREANGRRPLEAREGGSEERSQLGLQGPCLGRGGLWESPGGRQARFRNDTLKGRALKGWHYRPGTATLLARPPGAGWEGHGLWGGG